MKKKIKNIDEIQRKDGSTAYKVNFKYRDNYGLYKRYTKTFDNLKEAKRHANEMRLKFSAGFQEEMQTNITFAKVADEFMEVENLIYSHNTIQNTKIYLPELKGKFGSIKIVKLDFKLLQEYFNSRSKLGLETNKNIKKALNRILVYAIKAGYINSNPLQYVKVTGQKNLQKSEDSLKVITKEQFYMIIEELRSSKASESYVPGLYLMYYLGLRPSEAVCITFDDISFKENKIRINKKLNYRGLTNDTLQVSADLKTSASYSELPMPNELVDLLKEWKKKNPFNYVVCNSNGLPVNPDCLGNRLRKIVEKLGLKGVSLYTLRHSYITELSRAGINTKTFQTLARHSSLNTTYTYYVHTDDQERQKAIDKVFNVSNDQKEKKLIN